MNIIFPYISPIRPVWGFPLLSFMISYTSLLSTVGSSLLSVGSGLGTWHPSLQNSSWVVMGGGLYPLRYSSWDLAYGGKRSLGVS